MSYDFYIRLPNETYFFLSYIFCSGSRARINMMNCSSTKAKCIRIVLGMLLLCQLVHDTGASYQQPQKQQQQQLQQNDLLEDSSVETQVSRLARLMAIDHDSQLTQFPDEHDPDDDEDTNDDDNHHQNKINDADDTEIEALVGTPGVKRAVERLPRDPPTIPHMRITPEEFVRKLLLRNDGGNKAKRLAFEPAAAYLQRAEHQQMLLSRMIKDLLEGNNEARSRWFRIRNELGTALKRRIPDVIDDSSPDLMTRQSRPRIQPLRWG
ncbi:unnamed protein product [Notodromas monacha]|uniref:Uncharacterized protein n=1 Tax=Notodromas monacha TaxID=399045 RepID=A0A7R9BYZ9_9CRUS|nr:unnamed protein product [Notodromas monacha]CAD7283794.1 unnamed protein product [Notodromas monacha]CAG0922774.1 unnamed protein product [Notodromas monacha]CAG0923946.1 unnamed protein product [Notodromas monacha]